MRCKINTCKPSKYRKYFIAVTQYYNMPITTKIAEKNKNEYILKKENSMTGALKKYKGKDTLKNILENLREKD